MRPVPDEDASPLASAEPAVLARVFDRVPPTDRDNLRVLRPIVHGAPFPGESLLFAGLRGESA